jgi:hypothetical protein
MHRSAIGHPDGSLVDVASASTHQVTYSLVPEGLELSGPVTVSGRDTEENTIVLLENLGVAEDGVVFFCISVHLVGDILEEGLLDLVDVDIHSTSRFETSLLLLDHLADVTVHRVLCGLSAHHVHVTGPKLRARKRDK